MMPRPSGLTHRHPGHRSRRRAALAVATWLVRMSSSVGRVVERALHLGAGGVAAGVHDAPPRVPAFAGQRPPAGRTIRRIVLRRRPIRSPRGSRRRRSSTPRRDRTCPAPAARVSATWASTESVVVRQHHRDAALRVVRRGHPVPPVRLAEHDDPAPGAVGGQRGGQTRYAGADHDDVGGVLPRRERNIIRRRPAGRSRSSAAHCGAPAAAISGST